MSGQPSIVSTVLIYSNYHEPSVQLRRRFERVTTAVTYLAIDNPAIKQRVLENKTFTVDRVPCVIQIYTDGTIIKLDTVKAFDLVAGLERLSAPPPPPPPPALPPSRPLPVKRPPPDLSQRSPDEIIIGQPLVRSRILDMEMEEEPDSPPPRVKASKQPSHKGKVQFDLGEVPSTAGVMSGIKPPEKRKSKSSGKTKLADLDADGPSSPPGSEEPAAQESVESEPSSTSSEEIQIGKKKSNKSLMIESTAQPPRGIKNIAAAAQEMAKAREQMMSAQAPAGRTKGGRKG